MKCLLNHLSKTVTIAILFIITPSSLIAAERDDLYTEGLSAYTKKNHVEALKKLYAFYILNESEVEKKPVFKKKLKERISTSESILKLSFASNPSIQKGEHRTRIITRQGGGSFTGTGMEVEDLLNKKTIDLKAIQGLNHKALTMPSSRNSR